MATKLPVTGESLMDREIDDNRFLRNLDRIPLRTQGLQAIYRMGTLTLPDEEQQPRDPSSIPTGVITA